MKETVVVLGHRGMLGHVVLRYLSERGFRVATTPSRFERGREMEFLAEVAAVDPAAVVNCVGVRPGEVESPSELFRINALLPELLAATLGERLLVHPSSDGVFAGTRGPYAVHDRPDAVDAYGLSKRLAERSVELGRSVVLRTSLVGPERGKAKSLLAWLAAQRGQVRGYTDHLWNGVTTLTWARLCERALDGELAPGIHQPVTEPALSKHGLLEALCTAFALDVGVAAVASGTPVDRRLVATEALPPIDEQLRELAAWYGGERAR